MISLILTILYLVKDTVHRWFTRASSPLARVLVVFFLSLCALFFLGSYVISAKAIRDKIRSRGGDLVAAFFVVPKGSGNPCLPGQAETQRLLGADSIAIIPAGNAKAAGRHPVQMVTYDFRRAGQFMPLLSPSGGPTLLYPEDNAPLPPGPADISSPGQWGDFTVMVRHLPADHLLMRLMQNGALLVPPDLLEAMSPDNQVRYVRMLLQVNELENAESLHKVSRFLEKLKSLEKLEGNISSAAPLLEEMDIILGNQNQCRAAFCLGIVVIVGILLTALAGMEYRQNEFIYTLMKSFGIHPLLLVGTFIAENLVLVSLSFAAAVTTFMYTQEIIVEQFFKMGMYTLKLNEIEPEIRLISITLLFCILVSSLPIMVAANRQIGRVLK